MARTGRPPKPTERKIEDGTLRARDKQTPLVIGGREAPKPSGYLDADEKKRFRTLVKELEDAHILDKADRGMLELAAIEEANIQKCNKILAEDGYLVEHISDRGNVNWVPNPATASKQKSVAALRQLYGELGIGPVSRARLKGMGIDSSPETRKKAIAGLETARQLKVVKTG